MPPKRKDDSDDAEKPVKKAAKKSTDSGEGSGKGKKGPAVSDKEFHKYARPLTVKFFDGDTELKSCEVEPATFGTGSFGFKGSVKFPVPIEKTEGEEPVDVNVTCSMNITVIGSKPAAGKSKKKVEDDEE